MADDKPKQRDYLHAFTLYEDPTAGKVTSSKARKAYTDALEAKGFRPEAPDSKGVLRRLPTATMVGTFPGAASAITAVIEAEAAAEAADKGKFFRESSIVTPYRRLRLLGPEVAKAAVAAPAPKTSAKPAAATKPSQSSGILDAIREARGQKRS